MQIIATGKWSKVEKRWNMLVALRRPTKRAAESSSDTRKLPSRSRDRESDA